MQIGMRMMIILQIYALCRMSKQETSAEETKSRKNKYEFNLDRGRKILIESDFDNGNIGLIKQVTELQYRLEAIGDCKSATPKKTWFHFKVLAPKSIRVRLIIQNVSIYENMYEDKDWARPVMNQGSGWRQVKDCFLTYRGEIGIIIDHTFNTDSFVYFAMSVPHTYEESQAYINDLAFKIPDYIQFDDEIIGKSWGGLNLHLLRFTAKETKNKQPNTSSSGNLSCDIQPMEKKVTTRVHSEASIDKNLGTISSSKKPIIFITARVHPGEVGSSHCLIGIIDFLTRFSSLQSYLILKMFEVMIIPIVNPDGVFDGNYRMDLNNTNLNRVYQEPNPELHPTVYRIKQLITNLTSPNIGNPNWSKEKTDRIVSLISRKIMFHFDLHSHSCIKPAFIYGNAFDQIVTQTQSQLYCKLLEQNSEVFKYGVSHFGEKHMKMRDKGQALTKEGCARVVISKMANVVYSYTVETAIFPYLTKQAVQPITNQQFRISQDLGYEEARVDELINRYNIKNQLFLDNMLLGHSLMVTILDLLQKNPYSRFPKIEETLESYRKQISQSLLQNEERFKLLDIKAYQKVRNINKCCKEEITQKNQKSWDYLSNDRLLLKVKWPSNFKMFEAGSQEAQVIRRKIRTKTDVSECQRQINDFINPKNMRKKYLHLESEALSQVQEDGCKTEISPSKSSISPKNIQIDLAVRPDHNTGILPEIRPSVERSFIQKSRAYSNSLPKQPVLINEQSGDKNQSNIELKQMKELKEIKQLQQKQSTKNIVLSFIHEQMEKINTMRKNVQKSMAVQSRLASYKLIKKSSRSSKALNPANIVNTSANRYGIVLNTNSIINRNNVSESLNLLNQSKSKKKLNNIETCEEIINRRKTDAIEEDEEQEYEQEEGIYYVEAEKPAQIQRQVQGKRVVEQIIKQRQKPNRMPNSLQKISQYPVYTSDKERDPSTMVINSKRELAKVKYSQIKKKNIIRQDMNNSIKLPELKNINMSKNGGHEESGARSNRNGLSINVNLNLNLNVCIQSNPRESTGRARAATLPDQL